jgi:hypothetical protein
MEVRTVTENDEMLDLLKYIDALETDLKHSDPERFEKIIGTRNSVLLSLATKQREVIRILREKNQAALATIARLEAEISTPKAASQSQKTARQK